MPTRPLARLNLSVPAELLATVRAQAPGLNLSALMTSALEAHASCSHHASATCDLCGARLSVTALGDERLRAMWADVWWDVFAVGVDQGWSAEGVARAARDVASRHRVPGAAGAALPRPSRAARHKESA